MPSLGELKDAEGCKLALLDEVSCFLVDGFLSFTKSNGSAREKKTPEFGGTKERTARKG